MARGEWQFARRQTARKSLKLDNHTFPVRFHDRKKRNRCTEATKNRAPLIAREIVGVRGENK